MSLECANNIFYTFQKIDLTRIPFACKRRRLFVNCDYLSQMKICKLAVLIITKQQVLYEYTNILTSYIAL